MFPLHQSKKLVFQISSNNPHGQKHRILGHANMGKLAADLEYSNKIDHQNSRSSDDHNNKKKKMMRHRENERQRRQEMGTLHASLRSLLPLEFIKGKRSISDHMNEAVNYIKHLQNRIKRLDAKRAELNKLSNINSSTATTEHGSSDSPPSCFSIQLCCGGVQIVIRSGDQLDGFPLSLSISRVLEVLLEQGLSVVTCFSSKVNHDRLLHTIQCEVNDVESANLSELALEQKLSQVLFPHPHVYPSNL